MSNPDLQAIARAFKALSNPNRLRIYQEILQRQTHQLGPDSDSGCLLYDFINSLKVGAPTISHHVKELVNADLIRVERHGKFLTCYLNDETREKLSGFLGGGEAGE